MQIENYQKEDNPKMPSLAATFDVRTDKMVVRGLKIIRGKEGKPWFVGLPALKRGEAWKPYVEFVNDEHQKMFLSKVREKVEEFVQNPPAQSMEQELDIPF